ncbi:MAG: right-handed parallel beta-helix repeat-containing protein [Planctomycetota bacterium]
MSIHIRNHLVPVFVFAVAGLLLAGSAGPAWGQCQFEEEAKLLAYDGAEADHYGDAVAISGDVMIVGAYGDDDNGADSGSAYVYRLDGSSWGFEQKLLASDGAAGDGFGYAVTVEGDRIIVGALFDSDYGGESGAVYVFNFDGASWVQETNRILPDDLGAWKCFGCAVALSGDALIVGAYRDGNFAGAAYMFRRIAENDWAQEAKVVSSPVLEWSRFGASVAISGDLAIVGHGGATDHGDASGAAYVYRYTPGAPGTWNQEVRLTAFDGAAWDAFGGAVAISSDLALVGVDGDDDVLGNRGSVYVYEYDAGDPDLWVYQTKLLASDAAEGDHLGVSLAFTGEKAVVGACLWSGPDAGSAYVYRYAGSAWVEEVKLIASDGADGDHLGLSVGISGDVVLAGARDDDDAGTDSGSAYVFDLSATSNETLTVCWDGSGDYTTIQEALVDACNGDQIVVCDGTYTGPGNRDIDFLGKAVTVRSANGPGNCIIDCENLGIGFYFGSGETQTSVLDGFMITQAEGMDGGAIICFGGSPTIINCVLTGNWAEVGAGIGCDCSANPLISNCVITANEVDSEGAGICCQGDSNAVITDCLITGNTTEGVGAGVYCSESSPTIIGCTIAGNEATFSYGGAISCRESDALIMGCTIANNTSGTVGGGVYFEGGAPTVINSRITHNVTTYDGGGIYSYDSNATIRGCTISENQSAVWSAALYCEGGNTTVINSILWSDVPAEIAHVSGGLSVTYSDVQGGWDGEGNKDTDPLFVDPDGPDDDPGTWEDNDYHLGAGSPCIDTGNPAFEPEPGETDMDGEVRVWDGDDDGGARVDMGADEFGSYVLGNMNCDELVNAYDIDGFILAVSTYPDFEEYYALYPDCDPMLADCNCDGDVNAYDIDGFIALVGGG